MIMLLRWSILFSLLFYTQTYAQTRNTPPEILHISYKATHLPDRITLCITDDPAHKAVVTWRTNNNHRNSRAEIAFSDPSPEFDEYESSVTASSTNIETLEGIEAFHTVTFNNLEPSTNYVYRVGNDKYWSEWFQFKTADDEPEPFGFIYLGDAQNKVFSHVSRVIRKAYAAKPDAAFILHAGDLVNHADNNYEWAEWYATGSFIHSQIPVAAILGNHEYNKNKEGVKVSYSRFWNPQFEFPDNGPIDELRDHTYYFDYHNTRFVALNSNDHIPAQAEWLEKTLSENTKKWTVVTFHHPALSTVKERQNIGVIEHWLPLLEKYKVDLVLQGHDHTYVRGTNMEQPANESGVINSPIYVISVAGEKMYELMDKDWMQRKGENTQLYQLINISKDKLSYHSYTIDDRIYDGFQITKNDSGIKTISEIQPEVKERRFTNTLADPDE